MPNYLQHCYQTTTKRGKVVAVLDEPITTQDHDADAFIVTVSDAVFFGGNAYGDFVRADGVTIPLTGRISGDTATVILAPNCYTVPGRFFLTVKVEAGGSKTTYLQIEGYAKSSSTDEYAVAGDDYAPIDVILEAAEKAEQVLSAVADKAPAIFVDASGDIVQIEDGAEGMPVKSLVTHIEPVQEGEGDPSPNNVRAISGWDAASVNRTGKNLISETPDEKGNGYDEWYFNPPLPSGTYTISAKITTNDTDSPTSLVSFYVKDGNTVFTGFSRTGSVEARTVTLINPLKTLRISASNGLSLSAGDTLTVEQLQLEAGSAATAYEPYNGTALTAALPETVYGGTLDWGTGVLNTSFGFITLTGNETFTTGWSQGVYSTAPLPGIENEDALYTPEVMCTHAKWEIGGLSSYSCYVRYNRLHINYDNQAGGVDAFKSWLANQHAAGTPVQVAYKLKTPYTIQLTPQQLSTLKGTNNIWSNAGATEVTYAADTKMYIDQKIAAIAAAIV